MRRTDEQPLPPEAAAALAALDATLAGAPVDPAHADLAELALILRRERPLPDDGFAEALDERVARRFAPPARPARTRGGWRRRWLYGPGAALGAAAAGVAVVLVLAGHGGSSSTGSALLGPTSHVSSSSSTAAGAAAGTASGAAASSGSATASTAAPSAVPGPPPGYGSNRQIVQSAQLALTARPDRIDDVAQQVFTVVGAENGIVESSDVTATGTADGNASFQLSIPSANLARTLTALSTLRGATVASRTDTTADITGKVGGAGQRLAEARALRRSLLRQLAAATTTQQVNSLRAQLHDADASIASDLATLRGLQRQVAYSQIALTIQAAAPPVPVAHGSSFTLARSVHDAGRVLVVVAGAALIGLAALVPVAVAVALAAWVGLALRRRRREQALDLV